MVGAQPGLYPFEHIAFLGAELGKLPCQVQAGRFYLLCSQQNDLTPPHLGGGGGGGGLCHVFHSPWLAKLCLWLALSLA